MHDALGATAAHVIADRLSKQSQVLMCVAQLPLYQVKQRPGVAVAQSVMTAS